MTTVTDYVRLPVGVDAGPGRTTEEIARRIRHHIVAMCATPEGAHLGGALSCADVLAVLYFDVLDIDPVRPDRPERDLFLLSKGHAAVALYATLAERGFFPIAELESYGKRDSRLMGHPNRAVPGVELPTGSLGHGLALGLGLALSAKLRPGQRRRRAFVLLGDGELQEGSVWEAAMNAAGSRADNLTAIVDRNSLQLGGETEDVCPLEPLADRWRAFGWAVREVDGHGHRELRDALGSTPWTPGRPSVVIARTTKGKGVPFAEGKVSGHYATLPPTTAGRAHRALERSDREVSS